MYAIFHVEPAMESHHLPPFYREGKGSPKQENKQISRKELPSICHVPPVLSLEEQPRVKSLTYVNSPVCQRGPRVPDKRESCGGMEFRNEASKNLCDQKNSKTELRASLLGPFSTNRTFPQWWSKCRLRPRQKWQSQCGPKSTPHLLNRKP